jgi:hypothetical protein
MTGNKAHVVIRTDPENAFSPYHYPDMGGELAVLGALQAFMSARGYRKTESERRDQAQRSREQAEYDRQKSEAFREARERATHGDRAAMPEYYAKYGGDEGQRDPISASVKRHSRRSRSAVPGAGQASSQ